MSSYQLGWSDAFLPLDWPPTPLFASHLWLPIFLPLPRGLPLSFSSSSLLWGSLSSSGLARSPLWPPVPLQPPHCPPLSCWPCTCSLTLSPTLHSQPPSLPSGSLFLIFVLLSPTSLASHLPPECSPPWPSNFFPPYPPWPCVLSLSHLPLASYFSFSPSPPLASHFCRLHTSVGLPLPTQLLPLAVDFISASTDFISVPVSVTVSLCDFGLILCGPANYDAIYGLSFLVVCAQVRAYSECTLVFTLE